MRATGPTNTSPKVKAGSTMLLRPSRVQSGPSRPWNGSRPAPPTCWISSRPIQKIGTDTPITDTAMIERSIHEPWRRAARLPSRMPSGAAQIMQASISSTVGPKVPAISSETARLEIIERPRSSCSTRVMYFRNWIQIGWSRPICTRMASMSAFVAVGPADTVAGSVGTTCSKRKPISSTPNRTGSEIINRWAIWRAIVSKRLPPSRMLTWLA